MYTSTFLTIFAAAAANAAAVPVAARQDATGYPWQVDIYSIAGNGRGSATTDLVNATIHDPNTIAAGQTPTGTAVFPPSTAVCPITWEQGNGVPYNVNFPCTSDSEYTSWTVAITKPLTGAEANVQSFTLRFIETDQVTIPGKNVTKVFSASKDFSDVMDGHCSSSGTCRYSTDETVEIQQKEDQ